MIIRVGLGELELQEAPYHPGIHWHSPNMLLIVTSNNKLICKKKYNKREKMQKKEMKRRSAKERNKDIRTM